MAKLKRDPIGEADFVEYLETTSDFAFELRCLQKMGAMGFECQHGGPYIDRVTGKTRQFDIRGHQQESQLSLYCAVECKNLNPSFPLLVMCAPRTEEESFHNVVIAKHNKMLQQNSRGEAYFVQEIYLEDDESDYETGQPVGKSCSQIGRDTNDQITANDAEVFEKWSQALASAHELTRLATEGSALTPILAFVLPILVLPDGTLWQTDFNTNGDIVKPPFQTNRCSVFVNAYYETGFTASHLEIVTLSGLSALLAPMLRQGNKWFTDELIRASILGS